MIKIKEIRELQKFLRVASRGPWSIEPPGDDAPGGCRNLKNGSGELFAATFGLIDNSDAEHQEDEANAEVICRSRNMIRDLLVEVMSGRLKKRRQPQPPPV